MAESTLAVQLSDLASEIGSYLGYGRTAANWTGWDTANPYVPKQVAIAGVTVGAQDTQLGHIMVCVQAGCRQFYFPKLVDTSTVAYKWGFLTPKRFLNVVANKSQYDLPDDFGGMEGDLNYQSTDATTLSIKRTGIGVIQQALQNFTGITAMPTACAIEPKQQDGGTGQRWMVTFAPIPDASYTLTYYSNILPLALSANFPFPYGGAAHGETILESCLAVAESRFNGETQGTHWQLFQELLKASMTVDARDYEAPFLGYNRDNSDGCEDWRYGPMTTTLSVLVNGVQY